LSQITNRPAVRVAAATNAANEKVYINWGIALRRLNRPAEAFEQFSTAVRINPNSADAHYNLALLLSEANQINPARAESNKALQCDPKHGKAKALLDRLNAAKKE